MEEQKLIERPVMNEKEFKQYLEDGKNAAINDFYERNIIHLSRYDGVYKFRSIRRAIRRGLVSFDGIIYPKRPFNNRKSHIRSINNLKKNIYGQLTHRKEL